MEISGPNDSKAALADVQYLENFQTTSSGNLELTFFKTVGGKSITEGPLGNAMGKIYLEFSVSTLVMAVLNYSILPILMDDKMSVFQKFASQVSSDTCEC